MINYDYLPKEELNNYMRAFFDDKGICQFVTNHPHDNTDFIEVRLDQYQDPNNIWLDAEGIVRLKEDPNLDIPESIDIAEDTLTIVVPEDTVAYLDAKEYLAGELIEVPLEEPAGFNLMFRGKYKLDKFIRVISYAEKRAAEYPPLVDQIEAIIKGGEDLEAMRLEVQAVKDKYPVDDIILQQRELAIEKPVRKT